MSATRSENSSEIKADVLTEPPVFRHFCGNPPSLHPSLRLSCMWCSLHQSLMLSSSLCSGSSAPRSHRSPTLIKILGIMMIMLIIIIIIIIPTSTACTAVNIIASLSCHRIHIICILLGRICSRDFPRIPLVCRGGLRSRAVRFARRPCTSFRRKGCVCV